MAGGLVNTSFQFGGALVLAVATAVNTANAGPGGSPAALLDGFHAAIIVSLIAAVLGVAATALRRPAAVCPEPVPRARIGPAGLRLPSPVQLAQVGQLTDSPAQLAAGLAPT